VPRRLPGGAQTVRWFCARLSGPSTALRERPLYRRGALDRDLGNLQPRQAAKAKLATATCRVSPTERKHRRHGLATVRRLILNGLAISRARTAGRAMLRDARTLVDSDPGECELD
jgi:hypothetical protein